MPSHLVRHCQSFTADSSVLPAHPLLILCPFCQRPSTLFHLPCGCLKRMNRTAVSLGENRLLLQFKEEPPNSFTKEVEAGIMGSRSGVSIDRVFLPTDCHTGAGRGWGGKAHFPRNRGQRGLAGMHEEDGGQCKGFDEGLPMVVSRWPPGRG